MATSASADQTRGLFRVAPWALCYTVFGALIFGKEFTQGKPNWLILGGLTVLCLVACIGEIRKLLALKPGTSNERLTVLLGSAGAMLIAAFILLVTYRSSAAYAMHLTGLYIISSSAVLAAVLGPLALFMERKAQVRIYVGNSGWVYIFAQPPSNSTPHTDARGSSVLNQPPSARAGERGR